ncbi:MAG: DUF692 domain-containing protein [Pseudobdellovibrio sp.]
MNPLIQDLGVGVGLRPPHHQQFLIEPPRSVQWVEVISENFMEWTQYGYGQSIEALLKIREDYPVSLHGVSMNLGSVDSIDKNYLRRLKNLQDLIQPSIVSDHLSWTGVNGLNMHDLFPLPYTTEALNIIADKIKYVQDFLGRQILVENPSSYLEYKVSEMTESEFVVELLNKADCGLLLDVNNVYVSSINHNFDSFEYLKKIPSQRIGQIHLAGHSQKDGYLIDTHDAPICEDVWDLYQWCAQNMGLQSVMIERDGNIPDWTELEIEIKKLGHIREQILQTT